MISLIKIRIKEKTPDIVIGVISPSENSTSFNLRTYHPIYLPLTCVRSPCSYLVLCCATTNHS